MSQALQIAVSFGATVTAVVAMAGGVGSRLGVESASQPGKPRHAAPDQPGEEANADETGPAEAGAQAGPLVTGAERAPVDVGMASSEATRDGSTLW